MKFLYCEKCKKMVGVIQDHACPTMCCGQPMTELIPGTSDGAAEKHVPVVTCDGNIVSVRVGEVDHPMLEAHHIAWIALETKQGAQRKPLDPAGAPEAKFALVEGDVPVAAYEFCNLHGLWKKEF